MHRFGDPDLPFWILAGKHGFLRQKLTEIGQCNGERLLLLDDFFIGLYLIYNHRTTNGPDCSYVILREQ